jgi:hypothetical protein
MKWHILLLIYITLLESTNKISSIKLSSQIDMMSSKDDLSSLEGVLKQLQYITSPKNKLNKLSDKLQFNKLIGNEFKFKQMEKDSKNNMNKDNKALQDGEEVDTTDSLDLNLNISEDPIFSNSNGTKDKELERKEGIKNGNVLYNGKRTVNVETSEFADYYYEIIRTV